MRGPPVVLTNTLGRPVTNVISERGAVPMTVVNTLGEPVTLVASGGEPVTLFNANGTLWDYPFSLFSNNEQGAWYDPSDFSTLFQNSTGTTPVTAVEQPVRLMLDRSRGLVLGSELITNGDFSGGTTTGWTFTRGTGSVSSGALLVTATAAFANAYQTITTVAGRAYRLTANGVTTTSSKQVLIYAGTALGSGNLGFISLTPVPSEVSFIFIATGTTTFIFAQDAGTFVSGDTFSIDNISVRELLGNHALAPNDASRPVLRSRYNLLTYSEQFDNASWAKTGTTITSNAAVAPDGTTTADKMVEVAAASTPRVVFGSATTIISAIYTLSVYAQAAERNQIRIVLEGSGSLGPYFLLTGAGSVSGAGSTTSSITNVGNGWYRCVVTYTAGATNPSLYIATASGGAVITSGDNTKGVLLWGAQLLTSADQTSTGGAYQRIAAATDYDTSNPVFRPYLAFDGTDDSFSTSAIDFSGTDEMTVFAGVTKLSDAAVAIVMSYNGTSNASAEMFAPRTTGANGDFAFSHRTTTVQEAGAATVVLSPATAVLTGISDISASSVQLRRNGAVVQTVTTAIDANNYTSGTIRVGHRSSNLYLNGRLTSLIVLGRTATAAEISATESWVNGKTGAY